MFNPQARWDRRLLSQAASFSEEKIDVVARFSAGNIVPLYFYREKKRYDISRINFTWQEKGGRAVADNSRRNCRPLLDVYSKCFCCRIFGSVKLDSFVEDQAVKTLFQSTAKVKPAVVSKQSRIANIERLRFISAFGVASFHTHDWFPRSLGVAGFQTPLAMQILRAQDENEAEQRTQSNQHHDGVPETLGREVI